VVASVHSRFELGAAEQTERILQAIANPFTTILGHMTGRLLRTRTGWTSTGAGAGWARTRVHVQHQSRRTLAGGARPHPLGRNHGAQRRGSAGAYSTAWAEWSSDAGSAVFGTSKGEPEYGPLLRSALRPSRPFGSPGFSPKQTSPGPTFSSALGELLG
jgi:hypothetical protein